ncbi:MAG: hypothetical protein M1378_11060 [Bacteroidetes bacterium]|nr:hypothetical protein [Bacteroidota bacterium]
MLQREPALRPGVITSGKKCDGFLPDETSTDLEGGLMATTYEKRQKEMKRLEKRRQKAERRAQRKLVQREQKESPAENTIPVGEEVVIEMGTQRPEASKEN